MPFQRYEASGPFVDFIRSLAGKRTRSLSDELIVGGVLGATFLAGSVVAWLYRKSYNKNVCDQDYVSRQQMLEWYNILGKSFAIQDTRDDFKLALQERVQCGKYNLSTAVETYDEIRQRVRKEAWLKIGVDPSLGERFLANALSQDAAKAIRLKNDSENCSLLEEASIKVGALRAACQQYAILGGEAEFENYQMAVLEADKFKMQAVTEIQNEIEHARVNGTMLELRERVKSEYRHVRKTKPKRLTESMCGAELVKAQQDMLRWVVKLSASDMKIYFRTEEFLKSMRNLEHS